MLKTKSILFERWLLAAGLVLLALWFAAMLHGKISSRVALWQFDRAQAAATQPSQDGQVDFTLWSPKRVQAYKSALAESSSLPLAVIEIPKLHLRVPVFEGTDDLTLNRGVGRINGTAMPGSQGNIGIAGHRDGFFRGLKDISSGDEIDLALTTEKTTYVVDQIEIVTPEDVSVLQPRQSPSLTLVTCYPFYFVGDAPKRYIVHASMTSRRPLSRPGPLPSTPSAPLGNKFKETSK